LKNSENTLEYKFYKIAVDIPLIGERSVFTYRSPFLLSTGDLVIVPVGDGDAPHLGVVVEEVFNYNGEEVDISSLKDVISTVRHLLFPEWYVSFVMDISRRLLVSPFSIFRISYDRSLMNVGTYRILVGIDKECLPGRSQKLKILIDMLSSQGYVMWKEVRKLFGRDAGRLWKRLKDMGCAVEYMAPPMVDKHVPSSPWLRCRDGKWPLPMAVGALGKKEVERRLKSGECRLSYVSPMSTDADITPFFTTIKGGLTDLVKILSNQKGRVLVIARNRNVATALAKSLIKMGVSGVIGPTMGKRQLFSHITRETGDGIYVLPPGYIFKPWLVSPSIVFYDVDDVSIPLSGGAMIRMPEVVNVVRDHVKSLFYISPFPHIYIAHISDKVEDNLLLDNITLVEKKPLEVIDDSVANEIKDVIDGDGKVLVFASRLGYKTAVLCRDCGYVQRCPVCGFTMVYHMKIDSMVCHRCGHREKKMDVCPKCGGNNIILVGTGIELIEEELKARFGRVCVESSTRRRKCGKSEKLILGTFRFYRYFSEGYDLVYVPDMDFMWSIPTYTVWEDTMRLVYRLSHIGKKVIIGTNIPHIWKERMEESFSSFVDRELGERKLMSLPPYTPLLHMEYGHEDMNESKSRINHIYNFLHKQRWGDVWTPEFAGRFPNDGLYRWAIKVSLPHGVPSALLEFLEKTRPLLYYLTTV